MDITLIIILLIPFIGTTFGSAFVFFVKNKTNVKFENILFSLSSGIMIATSIFSLLIPAIDLSKSNGDFLVIPIIIGFLLGNSFLLIFDYLISYILKRKNRSKKSMMFFSVILHNIPEGMIVGVMISSIITGNLNITLMSALTFSLGIAIQNIPEGSIISIPMKLNGMSKKKAFLFGVLSGVVEPIAGLLTIILTNYIISIMPYILSFTAFVMFYVVFYELMPKTNSKVDAIFVSFGFLIMMLLDVIFG